MLAGRLVAGMKSDPPPRWLGRNHQFADGVEHNFELNVVFLLQGAKLACQVGIGKKHLPQTNKGAHDCDVHLHGARRLRKTLASMATPCSVKAIGAAPPNLPRVGITFCDTSDSISFSLSSNMKSLGERPLFRRTVCLSARVSTP